jgi:hypothetical protein
MEPVITTVTMIIKPPADARVATRTMGGSWTETVVVTITVDVVASTDGVTGSGVMGSIKVTSCINIKLAVGS